MQRIILFAAQCGWELPRAPPPARHAPHALWRHKDETCELLERHGDRSYQLLALQSAPSLPPPTTVR